MSGNTPHLREELINNTSEDTNTSICSLTSQVGIESKEQHLFADLTTIVLTSDGNTSTNSEKTVWHCIFSFGWTLPEDWRSFSLASRIDLILEIFSLKKHANLLASSTWLLQYGRVFIDVPRRECIVAYIVLQLALRSKSVKITTLWSHNGRIKIILIIRGLLITRYIWNRSLNDVFFKLLMLWNDTRFPSWLFFLAIICNIILVGFHTNCMNLYNFRLFSTYLFPWRLKPQRGTMSGGKILLWIERKKNT